jgi:hypothetical protein
MTLREFFGRSKNALKRPEDAFRRWRRRFVLSIAGIDLSKQTELQYVDIEDFESKILGTRLISPGREHFLGPEEDFRHNFDSKYLIEISNVIVNTENNLIYVQDRKTRQSRLLSDSSEWPSDRNLISSESLPRRVGKEIESAKLGLSNSGFYHFIAEDLSNLLLDDSNYPVLNYKNNSPLVDEVLGKIDIGVIYAPKWVCVKKLSFVSRGNDLGYLHPYGLKVLREFADRFATNNKFDQNVYISRIGTRRSIAGEEQIVEYLKKKGFRIVRAEDFSFEEQISIFRNLNILIGLHGAGLTHGIWSNKTMLIELMPKNRINRCFEWQTLLSGKNYERLLYEPDKPNIELIIEKLDSLIP